MKCFNDLRIELTSYGLIVAILGAAANLLLYLLNNFLGFGLWMDSAGTLIAAVLSGPLTAALASLITFTVLGFFDFSIVPYFLVSGTAGVILGCLHRQKNLLNKKSSLFELLGLSFFIGIIATMTYSLITILITAGETSFLSWITAVLIGSSNGLTNGVLTSLVRTEMLAQLLDKTTAVLIAFAAIRFLPESFFKNKNLVLRQKSSLRIGLKRNKRVIRAGKRVTVIKNNP